MAVVTVDTDLNQTVGVPYTVITDTSSDWPSVGNSIYFFDKETKLVHYKNASGNVISTYSEGGNISTSNLTQTDLNRIYTRSALSGVSRLRLQGTSHVLTLEDSANLQMFSGKYDAGAAPQIELNDGKIEFNGGGSIIQGVNSELILTGQYATTIESRITLAADVKIKSKSTRTTIINADKFRWANSDDNTGYGQILNGVFSWGGGAGNTATAIGSEGFSVQKDMLVKGSNNSASTSGFKVTDVNNLSLLDIKNAGEVVIGATSSNASAKLQVDSTTQGFAGPRMTTTERNAISTPLAGLEVYDTTLNSKMIYNGTSWDSLLPAGGGSGTKVLVKGAMGANQIVGTATNIVEFVTTGTPAGGSLNVNGEWDNTNHKFTVGASGAGTYFVQAQIFLSNGTAWSTLYLYKNGSIYSSFGGNGTDTTATWDNLDGTIAIDLVVGDYIDIRAFSSANGTISFTSWPDRQAFSIAKVSAVAPTAGTDVNALHTNISGEITALTAKATPTTSDVLVIEDAADSNNKKKSTLASIKNTVAPILTKTLTLEAPTASDDITIFKTDRAITVQEVIAVNVGTSPSTTYQLKYNAARNNAGTALTTSASTTSVVGGNVATLSNASIPADNWVWLETTAASGTGVFLTIDIRYTED